MQSLISALGHLIYINSISEKKSKFVDNPQVGVFGQQIYYFLYSYLPICNVITGYKQ